MPAAGLNRRRIAEKEASRAADRELVRSGEKSPGDLARENHLISRDGSFVRRPDGRPVILSIGTWAPQTAS